LRIEGTFPAAQRLPCNI